MFSEMGKALSDGLYNVCTKHQVQYTLGVHDLLCVLEGPLDIELLVLFGMPFVCSPAEKRHRCRCCDTSKWGQLLSVTELQSVLAAIGL
jgi:hypothetical protein